MSHSSMFEMLETRRLLAGDVTATFDGGTNTFSVIGDNKANQIVVEAETTGFNVTGLNGTTVNGSAAPQFIPTPGFANLAISLGNGEDDLLLQSGPGIGYLSALNVNVDTGNGDDNVEVHFGPSQAWISNDLTIDTGNGDDDVALTGAFSVFDLNVNLGNGADTATANFFAISINGNVNVNGGHGPDTVVNPGGFAAFVGIVTFNDIENFV